METKEEGTLSVKFFFTISSKSLCVSIRYPTAIVASVVYSLYDEVERNPFKKIIRNIKIHTYVEFYSTSMSENKGSSTNIS